MPLSEKQNAFLETSSRLLSHWPELHILAPPAAREAGKGRREPFSCGGSQRRGGWEYPMGNQRTSLPLSRVTQSIHPSRTCSSVSCVKISLNYFKQTFSVWTHLVLQSSTRQRVVSGQGPQGHMVVLCEVCWKIEWMCGVCACIPWSLPEASCWK